MPSVIDSRSKPEVASPAHDPADPLQLFAAKPVDERLGVTPTAGCGPRRRSSVIDVALRLADPVTAQAIQLVIEYDPDSLHDS